MPRRRTTLLCLKEEKSLNFKAGIGRGERRDSPTAELGSRLRAGCGGRPFGFRFRARSVSFWEFRAKALHFYYSSSLRGLWVLPCLALPCNATLARARKQLKRKRKLMGMGKSTALDERSSRFSPIGNAAVPPLSRRVMWGFDFPCRAVYVRERERVQVRNRKRTLKYNFHSAHAIFCSVYEVASPKMAFPKLK